MGAVLLVIREIGGLWRDRGALSLLACCALACSCSFRVAHPESSSTDNDKSRSAVAGGGGPRETASGVLLADLAERRGCLSDQTGSPARSRAMILPIIASSTMPIPIAAAILGLSRMSSMIK